MRVFTSTSYCYRYARDITIALLLLLLFSQPAHAEITRTINYQGFLINRASSEPVNGGKHMRFIFYDASTGGTPLFTEESPGRCDVPVVKGRYEVEIGSTNGGITDTVFQDNRDVWLEVQIAPDAVCDDDAYEPLLPRIRMQAAPYAFESLHASTASAASLTFRAATIAALPDAVGIIVSTHLFVSGGDLRVGDSPAITISSSGYLTLASLTSRPDFSAGRIFFDSSAKQLKISLDGSTFVPIATGTAVGLASVISHAEQFAGAGIIGSSLTLRASSVTLQGNIFNTADSLVMLDGASRLPAVSGSLLSGLIKLTDELQFGATFYVSSGTVNTLYVSSETVETLTVTSLLEATGGAQLRGGPAYDGLFVNSTGNVFVGTTTLPISGRFNVKGSGDAGKYLTVIYSGDKIAAWVRNKP